MRIQRFLVPVIIILILLVGLSLYMLLGSGNQGDGEDGNAVSGGGGQPPASTGSGAGSDGAAIDPPPAEPVDLKPRYYDTALEDRYASYAALWPKLVLDDVYWMVACNLDKSAYIDSEPVPDPADPMILANKYYYLPSDYVPSDMIRVGSTMMRKDAGEAMLEMIDAAADEGHTLWSQSGFRSYEVQTGLYEGYSARDGQEAADTYSARPGYSEHQTGLATDLNTITDAFGDTTEGIWAAENAWRFGFIMRYTRENTDIALYKYEPWHFRYVGKEAAKTMRDEGILSYEEYWVKYIKYPI